MGGLALLAAAVFLLCAFLLPDYRSGGGIAFAYMLLWFAACSPVKVRIRNDLSCRVYIYHWPAMQLLALLGLVAVSPFLHFAVGIGVVAGVAAASWFLIERTALARRHSPLPDQWASTMRHRRGRRDVPAGTPGP
ncbi:MAG: hypothetical protein OJJ54_04235 [Pseudonocardia sp.]|nr:hypothetical protein [Pseudonocardia sp.]